MLSIVLNAQVSDTTEADSSMIAGYIIILHCFDKLSFDKMYF